MNSRETRHQPDTSENTFPTPGSGLDIPPYNKQENEAAGFRNFGFIKLQDANLILTFDEDSILHVFKAEEGDYFTALYSFGRDEEDVEINMSHIRVEDFEITQLDGLESPDVKRASRVSPNDEVFYNFFGKDGYSQEDAAKEIPAEVVYDLFLDRSDEGLPDMAGFYEFKPGSDDSVMAAYFSGSRQETGQIFIIQPPREQDRSGTTQFNSQRGLSVFLQNIISEIKYHSSAGQDQVDLLVQMAIDNNLINYEAQGSGVDRKSFNDILRLIWHLKVLIDVGRLDKMDQPYDQDETVREMVPWIIWGKLNKFKKWLYKNQPTITLEASSWQELLIEYKEFSTVNYDLEDKENPKELSLNQQLIIRLERVIADLMKNSTKAQKIANRAIYRAIINDKVKFEKNDTSEGTQERNYLLALVWRIDVLNKILEAEQNEDLSIDEELGDLVPWVKWDKLSQTSPGQVIQWFYRDPNIILTEEEFGPKVNEYSSKFGSDKQLLRWREQVQEEKRRRGRY